MKLELYLRSKVHTHIRKLFIQDQCELCHSEETLHLHHLKLFSEIVNETLNELNIEYKETNDYSETELKNITHIVLGKHLLIEYVTLCDNCHKEAHKNDKKEICFNVKNRIKIEKRKQIKNTEKEKYNLEIINPYMEIILGKKLFKKEKDELIKKINYKVNGKLKKSYASLNMYLTESDSNYKIVSRKSNKERYWIVNKTD